ncbi:hypothetical protein F2Q69_00005988 [Brassica cretica]|uniref:Uncharacterized protein n=1 Tax=Brassica cretica TaxID=69181 RepID=A0A8S9NX28_BRACR|nr:hypothetical protein F2Q69_00005988 [Brassica cretica]
MSWRSWPEPVSRVVDVLQGAKPCIGGCRIGELWLWTSRTPFFREVICIAILPLCLLSKLDKSLGRPGSRRLEAGTQTGGKRPRPGGRNPEAGGRNLEAGSWSNNMVFFIRLRELYCSIKFLVEFGIDLLTCFNGHVFGLSEDGHVDVVVPLIPMTWMWIFRKNHHDETLPPWWGLVGVGRKFDGEAGNVCIKGDASAHTPDACATYESGILRGIILARLRIRGMRRFNKTRRPKLRILMLDTAGLACAS